MSVSSRIAVACGLTEEEAAQLAAGVSVGVLAKIEAGIAGKVAGPWQPHDYSLWERSSQLDPFDPHPHAARVNRGASSAWYWRIGRCGGQGAADTRETAMAAADAALLADGWLLAELDAAEGKASRIRMLTVEYVASELGNILLPLSHAVRQLRDGRTTDVDVDALLGRLEALRKSAAGR